MDNSDSFRLEAAIALWRAGLENSAALRATDLEELEAHLRDAIHAQQSRGLGAEAAFHAAIRQMGSGQELSREFAKTNRRQVWLNRVLWMAIGWMLFSWIVVQEGIIGVVLKSLFYGQSQASAGFVPMLTVCFWVMEFVLGFILWWFYCKHTAKIGQRARSLFRHPFRAFLLLVSSYVSCLCLPGYLIVALVITLNKLTGFELGGPLFQGRLNYWKIFSMECHMLPYLGAFLWLLRQHLMVERSEVLRAAAPITGIRSAWRERALGMLGGIVLMEYLLVPNYELIGALVVAFLPKNTHPLGAILVAVQSIAVLGMAGFVWRLSSPSTRNPCKLEAWMVEHPVLSVLTGAIGLLAGKALLWGSRILINLSFSNYSNQIENIFVWNFSGQQFWFSVVPILVVVVISYSLLKADKTGQWQSN